MAFNDEMVENFGRELPADYDFAAEREYHDERDYDEMADAFDDMTDEECHALENEYEDDGQPDEYTEWQDYYGGDDWDHGQYDEY